MKFKQFLNEAPTLEPKFQKEFTNIGKSVKYKERYNELFGNEDRIYLPINSKFNNRNLLDDDGENIFDLIEELDFDYNKLKNNMLFSKYLPKDVTRFEVTEVNIDNYDSKNRSAKIFFEINYKSKNINDYGEIKFNIIIPYKDLIMLSDESEERKKLLLKMLDTYNILLDSKNNGKNMQIVISRNPCDIGSMSTGTWWKSCMNLYTGMYNRYTRADVKHGTLIAYLILKGDKNIDYPLGRVLIKPYRNTKRDEKEYLNVSEKTYGYFPDEARNIVDKFIKEKQKGVEGVFKFKSKLYNDDDETEINNTTLNTFGLKVGDRIIFTSNEKQHTGKIIKEDKEYGEVYINFDKKWLNILSGYFNYTNKPNIYIWKYRLRPHFSKLIKKEPNK